MCSLELGNVIIEKSHSVVMVSFKNKLGITYSKSTFPYCVIIV